MLASGYGSGHRYLTNTQSNKQTISNIMQGEDFTNNSSIGYSKTIPKASSNSNTDTHTHGNSNARREKKKIERVIEMRGQT